jgi:hypothetical protein
MSRPFLWKLHVVVDRHEQMLGMEWLDLLNKQPYLLKLLHWANDREFGREEKRANVKKLLKLSLLHEISAKFKEIRRDLAN